MIFSKNSTVEAFVHMAEKYEMSRWSGKYVHPRDRVRVVYLSDDFNEPNDVSIYSDRLASQCSQEVQEQIRKETGTYVHHFSTWENKDNAAKAIQHFCLSKGMVQRGDKIVVTSIIGLVNVCHGDDCYYITYRVEKV